MNRSVSVEYLAGMLDGEGCISIARNGKGYCLRMTVANSNVEMLEDVARDWGGSVYVYDYHKDDRLTSNPKKWKPQGVVLWQPHPTAALLERLLPYLRVKRRQALLALQYQTKHAPKGGDAAAREACWREMRQLNGKCRK